MLIAYIMMRHKLIKEGINQVPLTCINMEHSRGLLWESKENAKGQNLPSGSKEETAKNVLHSNLHMFKKVQRRYFKCEPGW